MTTFATFADFAHSTRVITLRTPLCVRKEARIPPVSLLVDEEQERRPGPVCTSGDSLFAQNRHFRHFCPILQESQEYRSFRHFYQESGLPRRFTWSFTPFYTFIPELKLKNGSRTPRYSGLNPSFLVILARIVTFKDRPCL